MKRKTYFKKRKESRKRIEAIASIWRNVCISESYTKLKKGGPSNENDFALIIIVD